MLSKQVTNNNKTNELNNNETSKQKDIHGVLQRLRPRRHRRRRRRPLAARRGAQPALIRGFDYNFTNYTFIKQPSTFDIQGLLLKVKFFLKL